MVAQADIHRRVSALGPFFLPVPNLMSSSPQFIQTVCLFSNGSYEPLDDLTSTLLARIIIVSFVWPLLLYSNLHCSSNSAVFMASQSPLKYVAYLRSSSSFVLLFTIFIFMKSMSSFVILPSLIHISKQPQCLSFLKLCIPFNS